MTGRSRRTRLIVLAAVGVLALALIAIGLVVLNRPAPPPPVDSARLREAVTTENVMAHLAALQAIADEHDGNRAAGTPGHEASVDYVEGRLQAAGYRTQRQRFTYDRQDFTQAALARVAPENTTYRVGRDVRPLASSGVGSVTAPVTAVDLSLGEDRSTTSACEASDFEGFPRGNIALVQRGRCAFGVKVDHAVAAGASAVVVLNQGDTRARRGLFAGTLGDRVREIPVLATTFDRGVEWAAAGTSLRLSVDATVETVTTENLIADTATGRADRTVVVGAHLDGVAEGPGINDNGSGVAAVLETAVQLGELGARPANRVRFAFWSGEEDGLYGSEHYVAQLDDDGRRGTALYLNMDMVGSPNAIPHVYGGGQVGSGWPAGSGAVEAVLTDFLAGLDVSPKKALFRASDHAAFLDAGVPVGGLYTGSDELKSEGDAERFGGTADAPADPCYHKSCDRADAVDGPTLGLMADALAHATLTFAQAADPPA